MRQGYTEGYLRKSVVADPILRENTKDNTPAIIHYSIVPGDKVTITFAPKGFGSENMSRIFMLKPADGIDGVKNAILTAVKDAGPNACPPMVVGVGVGGTFEKCAILAKKALTRPVNEHSEIPYVADLEKEMLEKINKLGIGPQGFGGKTTAIGLNIRELQHAIEKAVILCEGNVIRPKDILVKQSWKPQTASVVPNLEEVERQAIETAILQNNGNLTAAAEQLGISRQTLYNKLKRFKP